MEYDRKRNELNAKLIGIQKENEFNCNAKQIYSKESSAKMDQILSEKHTIEIDYKTLKQKYEIDLQCKEETKKLEVNSTPSFSIML
jgi:hypothetical protein